MAALRQWIAGHWFYVVAAVSLALAGVFLVQYGIEYGLLPPPLRVGAALAFGAALIWGGERLRRAGGEGEDAPAAFLPSIFSGAGLVTLFAALLAARNLYDLIGVEVGFVGLVGVAILAVGLGWRHGPLLTASGLVGAALAPFLVGGDASGVDWLYVYFAAVAAVGLGVDARQRSAWVSTLALALAYAGTGLLYASTPGGAPPLLGFAVLVAVAATALPARSLHPRLEGAMTFRAVHRAGPEGWPAFPTRLAAGAALALLATASIAATASGVAFWLALGAVALVPAALVLWLTRAPALEDLAVPAALVLLGIVAWRGAGETLVPGLFAATAGGGEPPSRSATGLIALALGLGVLAARRSDARAFPRAWVAGSAAIGPAMALVLAATWQPAAPLGAPVWALHVAMVALVATVRAERALRHAPADPWAVACHAAAALLTTGFALSIVLTEAALTLALAGLAVVAAWLDRRFDVPVLDRLVQFGVVVCGWRLTLDPGIDWALDAALGAVLAGFLGTMALLGWARHLLAARGRRAGMVVAESALWGLGAILASVLLYRALDDGGARDTHWALALFALIWLTSAGVQLVRTDLGGALASLRRILAAIFATLGLTMLALAATVANPLFVDRVLGPPVLDTLAVAYALPAGVLALAALRLDRLDARQRIGSAGLAALLAALWLGLEIRRLWQGAVLSRPEVLDGELYSYTVALLAVGAALLILAFRRRSTRLRRIAVGVIALTVAKVFLIDMSGLAGLIRVFSFLALGLVLAGLAWLDTWMTRRTRPGDDPPSMGERPPAR
ncbi:MAG: DUF2339 domain-containing protein [Paracoccaceae bacterium]